MAEATRDRIGSLPNKPTKGGLLDKAQISTAVQSLPETSNGLVDPIGTLFAFTTAPQIIHNTYFLITQTIHILSNLFI